MAARSPQSMKRPAPRRMQPCGGCNEPVDHATKVGDVHLCDSCIARLRAAVEGQKAARKARPSDDMRACFRNDSRRKR